MNKNLDKALAEQNFSAAEQELRNHLKTKINDYMDFQYMVNQALDGVKRKISMESFKYDHPSDLYDEQDILSIKEFLNIDRGADRSDSYVDDKWDYLDDLRDKFKDNYKDKVRSYDLAGSEELKHLYTTYKTKVNPQSPLTQDEFITTILSNPVFVDILDTSYFNYTG